MREFFVHVLYSAALNPRILVKTVGSDVVVIAISVFQQISSLQELWIEFGAGKSLKFIRVLQIALKGNNTKK